ncbi:MBL fold metallo-hydrolase [Clostridium tarantellae]|uniref:MBL fold metallo-hydrolase n=1 Tax=Clostridium tarantellae TaxID=39493 RepID=A0A6I1MJ77_9CLOT|nr:MBL fold metallo-hydrolase [Clostridium tarantellae]MPQ42984.1 MBL fold metallo-hydrolase [Clostridium tarantellae]
MIIKAIPAGIYDANCYLIIDEKTKECIIMDPGGDAPMLINQIDSLNVKPKCILLTHGHIDHVSGVVELKNRYNIPFYINKKDEEMIEKKAMIYGDIPKADGYLDNLTTFNLGENKIKCIETPGHTPGGICFLIGDNLFTGDTLFLESVGRCDFPGGSHNTLVDSIKNSILPLGDNITVYPGHGPKTTIAHERKRNPYLIGDFYVY